MAGVLWMEAKAMNTNEIGLTTSQQFDLERMSRAIDQEHDIGKLKEVAKMLIRSWFIQRAATGWMMRQSLRQPQ
jgi:hypothetical protein